MKKIIALILALTMALAIVGCGTKTPAESSSVPAESSVTPESSEASVPASSEAKADVMNHEAFLAAEMQSEVTVDTYVQAKQGWWKDKANVYTQAEDGAYFIYGLACTEEEYGKLTEGTKIRVHGFKAEFSGEIEISDATFEILDGNYVAKPLDITGMLADEAKLLEHQNEKILVNGLTVKKIDYKNGEPGDDIYLTLTQGDAEYKFCVEVYLTGTDTDVYKTVGSLKEGDKVNLEGYLYWYEGANPHITAISVVK